MVNVDQEYDLSSQTQNKADNVSITVTYWCGYVTVVNVEKQHVVRSVRGFL